MKIRLSSAAARLTNNRCTARFGPTEWILVLLLLGIILGCLSDLAFGETPWTDEVRAALEAGEKLKIRQRIDIAHRYGEYVILGIAVFLLLLSPWWAVRRDTPPPGKVATARPVPGRWFYPLLLLALVCATWFRLPALDHSFWNDEELAFRKFNWGEYRTNDAGALEFRRVPWDYAFFYSISGNNHVAQTVVSKFSHELWMKHSGTSDQSPAFSEAATRVAPLLFGLLTITALALALRSAGLGITALIAAWLLALHPWHLTYSVQARGYSGMLFFIVLSFWFLGLALRDAKWKWWLLFGTSQCLYLMHFAGAIYLAAATNIIVFAVLMKSRAFFGLRRWLVGGVFSAMAFVAVMAPSLLAIFNYLTKHDTAGAPDMLAWLRDLWTHLAIGMPWAANTPSLAWGTSATELLANRPALGLAWEWLLPILLGTAILLGPGRRLRSLNISFASLLLAMIFAIGHSLAKNTILHEWYLLYLMLGVVVAAGLLGEFAVQMIGSAFARLKTSTAALRTSAAVTATVMVALYAVATHPQRVAFRDHDLQPMRTAVEMIRGEVPAIGADDGNIRTVAVGPGCDQLRSYDPLVRCCRDENDLAEALRASVEDGSDLAVYCISPAMLERTKPEMHRQLNESGHFSQLATLKSVGDFWSMRVYRHDASSSQKWDLHAERQGQDLPVP